VSLLLFKRFIILGWSRYGGFSSNNNKRSARNIRGWVKRKDVSSVRNFRSVRNSNGIRGRVFRSFASKASRGLYVLARCRLTNKHQHIIIIKGSNKTNAAFSSDLTNFQLSALILVLLLKFSILQVIIRNSDAGGVGDVDGMMLLVSILKCVTSYVALRRTFIFSTLMDIQWELKIMTGQVRSLMIFDPG